MDTALCTTARVVACPTPDDPERFATAGPPLPGMEVRVVDPATGAALPQTQTAN